MLNHYIVNLMLTEMSKLLYTAYSDKVVYIRKNNTLKFQRTQHLKIHTLNSDTQMKTHHNTNY